MQTPGINKMETAPVGRLLISLSLPIMFSMMIQALYNIVDSVFISRFSEKALGAVSLTFPMQTLMIAVSIGTCIGINAFLSRTLGEKSFAKARAIVQHGALLATFSYLVFLFIGVFFTQRFFEIQTSDPRITAYGMDYMSICLIFSVSLFGQQLFEKLLQAGGRAVLSMLSQIVGAAVNVILDPILIFGLAGCPVLGAKGAAIATVIGQTAAFACAFIFNQRFGKETKLSFAGFRFDPSIVRQIYKIGLPAIIMQAIGSIANFLMNAILLTFSGTALAFYGIYFKLQGFVFMPIYGLCAGMLPLMSYNLGAGLKKRVNGTLRYGMLYMAVIMAAGTILFQVAPDQLLSLFDASEAMLSIGILALRIISPYFIFEGFCVISQTSFQSFGQGLYSLICSVTRQIIVLISAAWLLSLSGDIDLVWLAFPVTGIIGSVVCLVLWRKIYKKI